MVFSEFEYKRPNIKDFSDKVDVLVAKINNAKAFDEVKDAIYEMNKITKAMMTDLEIGGIRYTLNTNDEFYAQEQDFIDENAPLIDEIGVRFAKAVVDSKFQEEISKEFGKQYIRLSKNTVDRFAPELIPFKQEENKLSSEYQKLVASCNVDFNGEKCNIYGLLKHMQDPDRSIRKLAFEKWAGFFAENEEKLDEIYDKLVHLRDKMGKALGFENFVPLGYMNMGRLDYTPEQVGVFREQVRKYIVPVCAELRERQAKKIGVDKLKYYDEGFMYTDGNAMPIGDREFLVGCAQKMYNELSEDTGKFFKYMVDTQLLELDTKPGKAVGGYCTFIPDYNSPFIFSNFNGTSADVDVLTHEAGHAFMSYCSARHNELYDYLFSTNEVNEIHSMSMEFFAHPWMELFFGDAADKYRYAHTADSLEFVPYGVCVDEFQEKVYSNPDLTPKQRKELWHELEQKYLPTRDFDGNEFMENGGFWQKQSHIFLNPFYYIDYTLASMGAFEFYGKMKKDRNSAWTDYVNLCNAGGSLPYLELLSLANLSNPFEEGSVEKAISSLVEDLNNSDY